MKEIIIISDPLDEQESIEVEIRILQNIEGMLVSINAVCLAALFGFIIGMSLYYG